jgi:hypothetical protein
LLAFRSPRITNKPGKNGRVEKPYLQILGQKLATLPTQKFNLDPRTQGFRFPNLSYRKEDGLGVNWNSGWFLDGQTTLTSSYAAFRGTRPGYSVQVARSWIPAAKSTRIIAPRSDLAERHDYSYFDNVNQPAPKSEEEFLEETREALSIGSYWFQASGNDQTGADYTKPLEVAYEKGGQYGPIIGFAQARLQTIRRDLEPVHTRLQLNAVVAHRSRQLTPQLYAYASTDLAGYLGQQSSGWLRGQLGLTFQPIPQVTLGAAVHQAIEAGNPLYPIDALDSPRGGTARVDLNLGPTQFTYLWRYDTRMGWFDRQYMLSQVVGCLEPYVVYRQFADDYRIGVNLRLGNLVEVLSRRRFEREGIKPTTTTAPGRAR